MYVGYIIHRQQYTLVLKQRIHSLFSLSSLHVSVSVFTICVNICEFACKCLCEYLWVCVCAYVCVQVYLWVVSMRFLCYTICHLSFYMLCTTVFCRVNTKCFSQCVCACEPHNVHNSLHMHVQCLQNRVYNLFPLIVHSVVHYIVHILQYITCVCMCAMCIYKVVFLTGLPDFQYQNEKQVAANQD